MKRFHVHLQVQDLAGSVAFYSRLFAQAPTRQEADYAKWMLADPPVNFAISSRSGATGLDHLGFQVEDTAALATLRRQTQEAQLPLFDEGLTQCCYAESDKFWLTDPQGVAWEHFCTLGSIDHFDGQSLPPGASACCGGQACVPPVTAMPAPAPASACCSPGRSSCD